MHWLRGTGKKLVSVLRCMQLNNIAAVSCRNFELPKRYTGSAADYLKHKRGLAILVTCKNGRGRLATDRDAAHMLVTLQDHLGYKVYQLQNESATKNNVSGLLARISNELSQYNGPYLNDDGRHKAIIFAFAGHGNRVCINGGNCTSDGEKEDVICTYIPNAVPYYNYEEQYLRLKRDVLKKLMVPNLRDIPKLFFIDACRVPKIGKATETTGQEAGDSEVNYRIDYATIPGYNSSDKAQWMITVAKLLRGESLDGSASLCADSKRDLSLGDVMSEARKHVIERSKISHVQIPETATDRLKMASPYLLPKPQARKLTLTLVCKREQYH